MLKKHLTLKLLFQVIVQTVNKLPVFGEIKNLSPVLSSFLPTLLLVTVAAVMPALVGRSESLVRHWTRSSLNRATMRKTLLLLLLMVLILPSLGLTSAQAVLDWTVAVGNNTERWECIFLPDQVPNWNHNKFWRKKELFEIDWSILFFFFRARCL